MMRKKNAASPRGDSRRISVVLAFFAGALVSVLMMQLSGTMDKHVQTAHTMEVATQKRDTSAAVSVKDPKLEERRAESAASPNDDAPKKRTLREIFIASRTDKHWRHFYDKYYDSWFAPYRSKKKLKILEIGAEQGHSLKAWAEYFDDPALIVGLAYGSSAQGVEAIADDMGVAELKVVRGDQSKKETMDQLCAMGPFDAIIDDGSHMPKHMLFSFFSLFKNCLSLGGIYVVEDLECNYWTEGTKAFGYPVEGGGFGVSPADSMVEKMKQFVDILPRYQLHSPELSIMDGDDTMCSIEFGMNIVAVKKCTPYDIKHRPGHLPKKRVDEKTLKTFFENAVKTNPI